jgi:hypothetical protein
VRTHARAGPCSECPPPSPDPGDVRQYTFDLAVPSSARYASVLANHVNSARALAAELLRCPKVLDDRMSPPEHALVPREYASLLARVLVTARQHRASASGLYCAAVLLRSLVWPLGVSSLPLATVPGTFGADRAPMRRPHSTQARLVWALHDGKKVRRSALAVPCRVGHCAMCDGTMLVLHASCVAWLWPMGSRALLQAALAMHDGKHLLWAACRCNAHSTDSIRRDIPYGSELDGGQRLHQGCASACTCSSMAIASSSCQRRG